MVSQVCCGYHVLHVGLIDDTPLDMCILHFLTIIILL